MSLLVVGPENACYSGRTVPNRDELPQVVAMGVRNFTILALLCVCGALVPAPLTAQEPSVSPGFLWPRSFGPATPNNRYSARFTPLLTIDFESNNAFADPAFLTVDGSEVIEGARSLRLPAQSRFVLNPQAIPLQARRTYVIEYDYRLPNGLPAERELGEFGGLMVEEGESDIVVGRSPGDLWEESGTIRTGIYLESSSSRFAFISGKDVLIIDNVRLYRHDVDVARATVPFWTNGFPRLGNYSLTSPAEISIRSHTPVSEVEQTLSLYDFVTGTDIDHTSGASAWVKDLRERNPEIRLLPYHNSFAVSFSGVPSPLPGVGLSSLFANGVADEWFLTGPDGEMLLEPDYPFIFQANHTSLGALADGRRFTDYALDYLGDTVLSSGLWDGIHFDQPEWYPNPLLIPRDFPPDTPPPPMDFDRDGAAETTAQAFELWGEAYGAFFKKARRRFGPARILFGNSGYVPANPEVLPALNGFMQEIYSPYEILENGEWDTNKGAGWQRIHQNYALADALVHAPQTVALEFVGDGLGVPTGTLTDNGLPDRTKDLTELDYRRMRLGLTTTLLGNGFFEYDLVDNTSVPLWFDEYAVDENGVAVQSASGKGYLGQPLGPPQELMRRSQVLVWADFDSVLPPWVGLGPNTRISNNPSEVIEGAHSLVVTRSSANDEGTALFTDPQLLGLFPGHTYQLLVDFRVLNYEPKRFQGLIGAAFQSPDGAIPVEQSASLFQPDVAGVGQAGTLRAVVKIPPNTFGHRAIISVLDNATVAFDRIRILDWSGGVYRRDFENGVVLANPTPERLSVSISEIAGPLNRKRIRRIQGDQVPALNNGQFVHIAASIPPGDGIILLADRIEAADLKAPEGLSLIDEFEGQRLQWTPADEYVAGYLIRYGHDPASFTREAAAGRDAGFSVSELDLRPGWSFYAQVAAVDFLGEVGPFSDTITGFAPGERVESAPEFSLSADTPVLVPGGFAVVEGFRLGADILEASGILPVRLGETQVTVNGVPAPLLFVSPRRVEFIVPWEVAGKNAIVRVSASGVSSGDLLALVQSTRPEIVTSRFSDLAILSSSGNAFAPVAPGDTVQLIAYGLGRIAGAPFNGTLPQADWEARVLAPIRGTVDGSPLQVLSAQASDVEADVYHVSIRVPDDLGSGAHVVRLQTDDAQSNAARILVIQDIGE